MGARAGATGAGARGRAVGAQAASAGRAGGTDVRALGAGGRTGQAEAACRAHGTDAAGARPERWARGLGAWAGLGLCTRCTRPIFDPF